MASYVTTAAGIVNAVYSPQGVAGAIVELIEAGRADVRRYGQDWRLSQAARVAYLGEVAAVYAGAVERLRVKAEGMLAAGPKEPAIYTPPDAAQFEAQAMRIWARVERQLSAGVTWEGVVQHATREELSVFADEWESYTRAQNPTADEATIRMLSDAFHGAAVERLQSLWTEGERAQYDRAQAWAQGAYRVRLALNYATGDFSGQFVIPTWDGGILQVATWDGWPEPAVRAM